jgi:hypothetical protein
MFTHKKKELCPNMCSSLSDEYFSPRSEKDRHFWNSVSATKCVPFDCLFNLGSVSHLEKGHRLMMSQNRVLGRIFGPKVKVTGDWKILYNQVVHNLYYHIVLG